MRSIPAWAGEPIVQTKTYLQIRVYPRVGGGAFRIEPETVLLSGLSPRGRGSRPANEVAIGYVGSIPAWAGEPVAAVYACVRIRVYPRVGGGALIAVQPIISRGGLSPRGRGSLIGEDLWTGGGGSIPAWAGEPRGRQFIKRRCWVYPRVGGGAGVQALKTAVTQGLSPRGRGSHLIPMNWWAGNGSIPAWAGEPR